MFILKEWAVVFRPDPTNYFLPPEAMPRCLAGKIYGRPRREIDGKEFPDGKSVRTSPIVKAEGKIVTTRSGSVYKLEGPPEKEYLEYLEKNDLAYDEDFPIKIWRKNDLN